jgi:RNA polymerase sigma factor (sigma-70 family)
MSLDEGYNRLRAYIRKAVRYQVLHEGRRIKLPGVPLEAETDTRTADDPLGKMIEDERYEQFWNIVQGCMRKLSVQQRMVFMLAHSGEELSPKEISSVTGISYKQVTSVLTTARHRVKRCILQCAEQDESVCDLLKELGID